MEHDAVLQYSCAMNHKTHITGIVMHILPRSSLSVSPINHNYVYTCKIQVINIRVTTVINYPCATSASELLDDSQGHKQLHCLPCTPL